MALEQDLRLLTEDELGRLLADCALAVARAQEALDAALDELARRHSDLVPESA